MIFVQKIDEQTDCFAPYACTRGKNNVPFQSTHLLLRHKTFLLSLLWRIEIVNTVISIRAAVTSRVLFHFTIARGWSKQPHLSKSGEALLEPQSDSELT